MRRHLIALTVAGLALASFGCSSSDDNSSPSSTTTSSVVVSAANKPTCDAIASYKNAADVPLSLDEAGDPVQNAMKIQAFIATLIAPLEGVKATAPADLKSSIDVLVVGGQGIIALDPADAQAQQEIGVAIIKPSGEMATAREALINWSSTNCGIAVK